MTKPVVTVKAAAPCPKNRCSNDGKYSMAIYDYNRDGKPVNPKSFCQVCGTVYNK